MIQLTADIEAVKNRYESFVGQADQHDSRNVMHMECWNPVPKYRTAKETCKHAFCASLAAGEFCMAKQQGRSCINRVSTPKEEEVSYRCCAIMYCATVCGCMHASCWMEVRDAKLIAQLILAYLRVADTTQIFTSDPQNFI